MLSCRILLLQSEEIKKEKEKKEKDKEKDDESTKEEGNVTVKIEKLGDAGLKTDMYAKHLSAMKVGYLLLFPHEFFRESIFLLMK